MILSPRTAAATSAALSVIPVLSPDLFVGQQPQNVRVLYVDMRPINFFMGKPSDRAETPSARKDLTGPLPRQELAALYFALSQVPRGS